jgi:hypothetical protein
MLNKIRSNIGLCVRGFLRGLSELQKFFLCSLRHTPKEKGPMKAFRIGTRAQGDISSLFQAARLAQAGAASASFCSAGLIEKYNRLNSNYSLSLPKNESISSANYPPSLEASANKGRIIMRGNCIRVAFFLILSGFVTLAVSAQDQSSVRGQLGGTVVDSTGAVIQGAAINLLGPTGNATRTSSEQGEFTFPALAPGFYDVKVSKEGFKGTTVQKIEVSVNKTSTIRVVLELGAVTQTIEVVASSVSVESQSTAVTADITDTVYNNLPLGRSITSTFYLSPGVASGLGTGAQNPAISGSTGLENAYIADGVLLNDAAFGGLGVYQRRYGGIGVGINSSFVKEVQVNTAAFGPEIGHTTGGAVIMVTKSGSNAFHGTAGGYFQSRGMSAAYANQDDFQTVNKIGRILAPQGYEGDFELGGYVPVGYFKNHLFFFGAFNPTWNDNFVQPVIGSGLFTATNGQVDRKDTIWDYSAKVTWQLNENHSIQGSVFGDPTHSDNAPWQTLNIDNVSANTTQTFGSRNVAAIYNGTIGPSLTLFAAFTMNWNNFTEAPLPVVNITDETQAAGTKAPVGSGLPDQRGAFRAQGFGSFENYTSNQKGVQFDVHKVVTILGQQHTFSAGYTWAFPTYNDTNGYSGGLFPIDVTNIDGDHFYGSNEAAVTGQSAEFHTLLQLASSVAPGATPGSTTCTKCPYMDVPGFYTKTGSTYAYNPQQVVLVADRGPFSAFTSVNTRKVHAAYVKDDWEMSKYATLSMGVRWEQQRMTSGGATQLINDQWGPRIGFTVDPKGDRKSKIYVNFGRYAWIMPLDAAIRELTAENQVENIYFAPDTANCSGGVCGVASPSNLVTLNQYNTVTFDSKNILNNAVGGVSVNPTVNLVSGGGSSPFQPGTRMEYTDEFVIGAEHEFRGGISASVRYIDRRIKRIIEDFQSVSVEQQLAGIPGFYAIGNPGAKTDVVVNPNEITWMPTAAQVLAFNAAGGGAANASLLGPPTGCSNSGGLTPKESGPVYNTLGTLLGAACFPSVNGIPNNATGAKYGGEVGADGVPDGYPNATRNYQAIEIEINKSLSHNWSLISNWRIARLIGNFEGAFRNDNGQNDPGISSLYDFTPGELNLLGSLLVPGPLNADRLHIVNIYPTYTFDKSILKGLIVTPGVKFETGNPLTTLAAQQAYTDQGEAILNHRGDLGHGPVTGTVDVHVDYPWRISEGKTLHFEADFLNIANTKRNLLINQNIDLDFEVPNKDFQAPGFGAANAAGQNLVLGFVQPFNARFHVSFNF